MSMSSFPFSIFIRNHSLNELISGKISTKIKPKKDFFASDSDSVDTISSESDSSLSSESSLSSNGDKKRQKFQKIELQIFVFKQKLFSLK